MHMRVDGCSPQNRDLDQLLGLVAENVGNPGWTGTLEEVVCRDNKDCRALGGIFFGLHLLRRNAEILEDCRLDLGGIHSPAGRAETVDLDAFNRFGLRRCTGRLGCLTLLGSRWPCLRSGADSE